MVVRSSNSRAGPPSAAQTSSRGRCRMPAGSRAHAPAGWNMLKGRPAECPAPRKRRSGGRAARLAGMQGPNVDSQAQRHAQVSFIIKDRQSLPSPCCSSDSAYSIHQKRFVHRGTAVHFAKHAWQCCLDPFLSSLSGGYLRCPNGTPCRRRRKPRRLRHTDPARGLAQPAGHPSRP